MTTDATRHQFFARLEESGVFSKKTLHTLRSGPLARAEASQVAAALVREKRLTRFQAESLLAGKPIHIGQYVLVRQLGKGGIGRVYQAVHRTMNRVVALKLLAPQLMETGKAKALFQREILAIGGLVHPHIVTAYDACTTGEHHYLVMEYVDGPNLEELVRRRGPLPVGVVCEMIRQAATGLQYAHERGMLHRDIKPANILAQRNPAAGKNAVLVKLVDFGLARLREPGVQQGGPAAGTIYTPENTVMGTPDFLSPEQSRNLHDVDIRSDLYSLGCTMYYLLTGQVPFPGGTSLEKMIKHTKDAPTPIHVLRPEVPDAVIAVADRLMAKQRSDRYATPAELIAALEAVQGTLSAPGDHGPTLPVGGASDPNYQPAAPNQDPNPMAGTWPDSLLTTPAPLQRPATEEKDTSDRLTVLSYLLLLVTALLLGSVAVISYLLFRV